MNCPIRIVKRDAQKVSEWSGGTTTELAIYPEGADYKTRNFKWRLSSARVDVEESTFTSLPGIWRLIMIIDGEMLLEHENHHRASLKPFEQDSFSGSWTTLSKGKAKDFNLMLAEGCEGEIKAIEVDRSGVEEVINPVSSVKYSRSFEAVYCVKGGADIEAGINGDYALEEGDLLLIEMQNFNTGMELKLLSNRENEANIIRASIRVLHEA
ncbi:MAG: HutD family protein [Caulobacteraceae bacterium]